MSSEFIELEKLAGKGFKKLFIAFTAMAIDFAFMLIGLHAFPYPSLALLLTYITWMLVFMVAIFVFLAPGLDMIERYSRLELRTPIAITRIGLFVGILLAALALYFGGIVAILATIFIAIGWIGLSITMLKSASVFSTRIFYLSGGIVLLSAFLLITPALGFTLWLATSIPGIALGAYASHRKAIEIAKRIESLSSI